MKNKRLRYTIFITLILALVALVLVFNNKDAKLNTTKNNFFVRDTAAITKVYMVNKNNEYLLLEREGSRWKLNSDYYARKDIVEVLMETLYKIRIREPLPNAAINNAITQLASHSTKVEVYQRVYRINLFNKIKLFPHEKLVKTFYVGYNTQDNMGTIMLLEGSEKPVVTHIRGFRGALAVRFEVKEQNWRDLTLFNHPIKKIDQIIVEVPDSTEKSFILRNNKNKTFSLLDLSNNIINYTDTVKLLRYVNYFQDIKLDRYVKDDIDSILRTRPDLIISVIDNNGKERKAKFYKKPNELIPAFDIKSREYISQDPADYATWDPELGYVILNNDKDLAIGQYYMMGKVMRNRDYFLDSKIIE